MNKNKKIEFIAKKLEQIYPEVRCMLNYSAPHELLIATRLSAQCTDKRVNLITPVLFDKFRSLDDFAAADVLQIEKIVKPCGLFRTKAADIKGMCVVLSNMNNIIPDEMEKLLELPGVGRKTANLILGELYGKPAVVADTHVIRLSNRLGLVSSENPLKVELSLKKLLKPTQSLAFCHRLVHHGRNVCKARSPDCNGCELKEVCEFLRIM
jgi:endonuclease-3